MINAVHLKAPRVQEMKMHLLSKRLELYAKKPRLETSFDGPWVHLCPGSMLFPNPKTHLE